MICKILIGEVLSKNISKGIRRDLKLYRRRFGRFRFDFLEQRKGHRKLAYQLTGQLFEAAAV